MANYLADDKDVNVAMDCSDSEEEGFEDQNWDDWEIEDEQGPNAALLCLFCESPYSSCDSLFEHCTSSHHFDFHGIKKAYGLGFYQCFKLINYVRSQVTKDECWSCGKLCRSKGGLQNHLLEGCSLEGSILPWDDDRYLNPFLKDDGLLYSFDEDDHDDEDEDGMHLYQKEIATYKSQFAHLNIDDDDISDKNNTQLMGSLENGTTEATDNGSSDIGDGASTLGIMKTKKHLDYPSMISENEIKNINKNYFVSYSSFGIHRDMISDKVRTDTYRQAILENPSLIRGAVVMDVGCGTGILSLFAAQAGAAKVIAVEASEKMAKVATQIAKDNGLLRDGFPAEESKCNGVIEVVQGMVEELGNADCFEPHSVDVLVSEWMGYCLLYESMLSSVLFARDLWLKPGGAILPDTATMFVAGFGKGGTSLPFWENVYGIDMSCIGQEDVRNAAQVPVVDVIKSYDIVTSSEVLQSFDLATMHPKQMDFTAVVELKPNSCASPKQPSSSNPEATLCFGVVIWFDTGFSKRFCKEKPVNLSTSPYEPSTHWSQTVLTFQEPITIASNSSGVKMGSSSSTVGTYDCPAVRIQSRISIVRAAQHRNIDISMELTGIGPDGRERSWPAQMFYLK